MDSPRRDLTIGRVGGGPSLLNLIENQKKRFEDRSPRSGHSIREPYLRWREKVHRVAFDTYGSEVE